VGADSFKYDGVNRAMSQLLDESQIQQRLTQLEGWTLEGKQIRLVRKFKGFVESIAFINQLVEPAESANHHPDLSISYNKVTIVLTTHDAGGLTEQDFALAKIITQIS
jgi:4a-hydroxytetrahydrobiopterin dehydratase